MASNSFLEQPQATYRLEQQNGPIILLGFFIKLDYSFVSSSKEIENNLDLANHFLHPRYTFEKSHPLEIERSKVPLQ